MNSKLNKAIDKELKKERYRNGRKWLLLAMGIVVV
jgi:hypothetical protein